MISGTTAVYAVIGQPVAHSLSPAIHQIFLEAAGLDAVYVAFAPHAHHGPSLPDFLVGLGLRGANLTMPFKTSVLQNERLHADDNVRIIGAANTLVCGLDGRVMAYNTDAPGLTTALAHRFDFDAQGSHVVIFGAGGAARAAVTGLARQGARRIDLFNRTQARVHKLADDLACAFPSTSLTVHPPEPTAIAQALSHADLVINALSASVAWWTPEILGELPAHAIWYDLNYWMQAPPALDTLRHTHHRTGRGLELLLWQAQLAFEHFFGQLPPSEGIERARIMLKRVHPAAFGS